MLTHLEGRIFRSHQFSPAVPMSTGTMWRFRSLGRSAVFAAGLCALAQVAEAVPLPFTTTETGKYLLVGMKRSADGDAVNVNSSNELGADQQFLSTVNPNTDSVFNTRWSSATNKTIAPVPGSAPVFAGVEGVDWTGNIAVTSSTGKFSMSNMNVYADLGVHCVTTPCHQSVSNSKWFQPPNSAPGTETGFIPTVGVSAFNANPLLAELNAARAFIAGLTAELTITADMENGSTLLNLNAIDTNNNGVAVIDINRSLSDFKLNNFDLIIDGTSDKVGIFRIRGNSNMLITNSSIALGPSGIGGGSASQPPTSLGALFVHYEEPSGSDDQVFSGNNVILNGIGLWDLNAFATGSYSDAVKTHLTISNGQGCGQFISSTATMPANVRFNRCAPGAGSAVPEPSSVFLLGAGLAGLAGWRWKKGMVA